MMRFTFIASTLLLASSAVVAMPLEALTVATPEFNILPIKNMPDRPSGDSFRDWNSEEVTLARDRLTTFMRKKSLVAQDPNAPDAIDSMAGDKDTPQGLYAVVKDARDQFKNQALPAVNQLGQELPMYLSQGFVSPFTEAVNKYQEQIKKQTATSVAAQPGAVTALGESLPTDAIDVIRKIVDKMLNGSFQELVAKILGLDLALRVAKIVAPIALSALSMLVADLRDVVKHIIGSIMKGVEKSVWLKELRELVIKNLRQNVLAMLATIKTTLIANLGGLIIAAFVQVLHLGSVGSALIKTLFGKLIDSVVEKVVGQQIDRLSAYLRGIWNMPELSQLVNMIMTKTPSLATISAPAASASASASAPAAAAAA
ncbi:hypothetical protein BDF22DRAFT_678634 [Syncephalis plumigaleata]|nr:hypothetical protein BDF22DRAFT_678634 [Syncephalis plumigaleata]